MAVRKLAASEFPNIPEGEQIIRVKEVDETKLDLDKLTVVVEDQNGVTAKVNFTFVNQDETPNTIAEQIYARMCRALLNDQTADEVDNNDLVGCFARVEVEHQTGSKGGTFTNIKKWLGPADGFDGGAKPAAAAEKKMSKLDEIRARAAAKKS